MQPSSSVVRETLDLVLHTPLLEKIVILSIKYSTLSDKNCIQTGSTFWKLESQSRTEPK